MKKFSISTNKVVQSMTITAFAFSLSAAGAAFAQGGMAGQQGQEQSGMSGQGGSTPGAHPTKPYEKDQGQGSGKKRMNQYPPDMDPRGDIKPRPGAGSGSGGGAGTGGGSGSSSGGGSGTGGGGGY